MGVLPLLAQSIVADRALAAVDSVKSRTVNDMSTRQLLGTTPSDRPVATDIFSITDAALADKYQVSLCEEDHACQTTKSRGEKYLLLSAFYLTVHRGNWLWQLGQRVEMSLQTGWWHACCKTSTQVEESYRRRQSESTVERVQGCPGL